VCGQRSLSKTHGILAHGEESKTYGVVVRLPLCAYAAGRLLQVIDVLGVGEAYTHEAGSPIGKVIVRDAT
jgi:hypothetical protein